MTKMTRKYHRFTPDETVSELKDKENGKISYRHRFRKKNKSGSHAGTQDYKDYPVKSKKYKSFEEFKAYISKEFDYE